jgi:hypothetical protein
MCYYVTVAQIVMIFLPLNHVVSSWNDTHKGMAYFSVLLGYLCMCHTMIIQVGAGSEAFATHKTLVWFIPTVDASVCVE